MLASSRFGPTLPFEPAGSNVWQPPQPADAKTALPWVASPSAVAPPVSCGSVPSTVSAWPSSLAAAAGSDAQNEDEGDHEEGGALHDADSIPRAAPRNRPGAKRRADKRPPATFVGESLTTRSTEERVHDRKARPSVAKYTSTARPPSSAASCQTLEVAIETEPLRPLRRTSNRCPGPSETASTTWLEPPASASIPTNASLNEHDRQRPGDRARPSVEQQPEHREAGREDEDPAAVGPRLARADDDERRAARAGEAPASDERTCGERGPSSSVSIMFVTP